MFTGVVPGIFNVHTDKVLGFCG